MRFMVLAAAVLCLSLAGLTQSVSKPHTTPRPEARIDINHATIDELLKVPGITRSWAGRVVRFRPYHTKQDLVDRGIVTSQVYDRIKDYVIAHRDKQ
jgi:DNA uptake protein ComE-like DNA-binding protein